MKEQNLVIKNVKSFNLTHIFDCGQCFRWNKNEDESYTGVVKENVINIKSFGEDNLKELFNHYFDMNRDYDKIKKSLRKVDEHMEKSILYGDGIRLLNQDLWETIISFIISANNNIPRIKGIIERISKRYGNRIEWEGNEYYTFPTPEKLSKASVEDFRNLGLGFRDVRVYETTKMVLKVADCILLFSTLKRFDVFPIDVWVRRVMNDLYIHNSDENKVDKKLVLSIANEKFGDLCGIAQQYLFSWRREV